MIEVKDLVKSYNGEKVLKGVSLSIEDGEFVSIMGKSGSGKSSLLSIIGGFLEADSGEVMVDGKNILTMNDKEKSTLRSSDLGFVFQHFKLINTLTVYDNIMLVAVIGKRNLEETKKYVDELSKELCIDTLLNKFPDKLSGGQMQRVAIARALAFKPKLIILDEPTGALDSENEAIVMKLLQRVNKELNTTIVQVTHSERVSTYGTRTIRIKDGVIC